jgi:hypothetical protein
MAATGRVTIYDRRIHLDTSGVVEVGDRFDVVRGNGPREGDEMGVAIVVAIEDDGTPVLDLQFPG